MEKGHLVASLMDKTRWPIWLKWMGMVRSPDRGLGVVVTVCQSDSQMGNPVDWTRYSGLTALHPRSD